MVVKQIAGKYARRIVCYCREGDRVEQGQRIGLIQFGSGVEVHLPAGSVLRVALGERVTAGQTTLGFPAL